MSRAQVEQLALPAPCVLVRMADSRSLLAQIRDEASVVDRLDLVFNDSTDDFGLVRAPTDEDARRILDFVRRHQDSVPHLVFQCQVGVGRSLAAKAAILRIRGEDHREALRNGTHNRALYRKLLAAAGLEPEAEPLVSMVVRVKYAPDRMHAFLLGMQRQRYDNWELVFVTDGPNPGARDLVEGAADARVRLVETAEALGRWGHPHRRRGIEASTGELIGLSNDDNYYVPGYLEQMVGALEGADAELVMCQMLHSYWGWRIVPAGHDVGSWIARRGLVERTPWDGDDFFYDARYVAQLRNNAGARIAVIERPLFVHN